MRQLFIAVLDWYGRLVGTRWVRRLAGRSASGPCTWRVTYRTDAGGGLWARVKDAVARTYPPAAGYETRTIEHADPPFGGVEVYRGRAAGLIVAYWGAGSGPAEETGVRVGVGRWSRLAGWASGLTLAAACLLALAAVAALMLLPLAGRAPGAVVGVAVVVVFLLSLLVAGVAARFTLDMAVAAVERLGGRRFTDAELAAAVAVVRRAAEDGPGVAVDREGW